MKKGFAFKSKKEMVRVIIGLAAAWMLFLCFWHHPIIVHADGNTTTKTTTTPKATYGSWVQSDATYESIYGKGKEISPASMKQRYADATGNTFWENARKTWQGWTNPTQWVSMILGGVFILLGGVVNGLLGGRVAPSANVDDWVNLGHVDLTMDSVIFGRLLNGHPVNYVTWELRNGNFYGILSSFAYRLFWNVAFSAFVLIFFIFLIRQLLSGGDSRKRAELKDSLTHGLLVFLMIYLVPQIADICVYLRDWLLKLVYAMMSGDANLSSISYTDIFMAQWWTIPWQTDQGNLHGVGGVAMGILFFAASCAGLIFAIDYIRIAIKQTALFAFFPVFAVLSLKNKKLLSNWLVEFIPNIFIPVIDCVLLMLPVMVIRIANSAGLTGLNGMWNGLVLSGTGLDIGVFLIVCIMIFSVIPMRKEILKLIGQANPMGGSRGFGGVMAAGMMAMRMMGRGGSGISSGIENYGGMSAADNMAMANALENYGTANAGATAMAATSAGNIQTALETDAAVAEEFAQADDAMSGIPSDNFRELGEGEALDASLGGGLETADMAELPEGAEGTDFTIRPGEEGFDYNVDAFDGRIPEEMDGASAEMGTGEFYQNQMVAPTREENLVQMEGYQGMMAQTQQDIDTLSAENGYDKALLQRYESLGQDIEHARAGGGSGIVDGSGRTLSSGGSGIDAMEREREGIEKQMRSRIESYQPQARQAAEGAPLNNPDGRVRPESVAQKNGDLQGQMKEVIKDRESQIADNKKSYNEAKAGYEQTKKREAAFAQEAKAYGSSGEKFDSAEAYRKQREMDAVFKQAANYKNFDTKGISEHIDPATRARMYRERAQRQMEAEGRAKRQKAMTAAGVVTGAVVGGSAMMFGGEQAAMNGAMMGGMVGGMAGRGVSNPARAARKEEMQRRADLGPNENSHKTKITVHPKRTGIEGTRKIESTSSAGSSHQPTQQSVRIKRQAQETMQREETATQSAARKKAESAYRSDGYLGQGQKMIDDAIKNGGGKGGNNGKPKP